MTAEVREVDELATEALWPDDTSAKFMRRGRARPQDLSSVPAVICAFQPMTRTS